LCGCTMTGPFTENDLEKFYGLETTKVIIEKAKLSSGARNALPNSAFAFIDSKGVRHFPIHDKAHVRNALARVSQSPFGQRAMPKIRAAARKFGIGEPAKKSENGFTFEVDIHKADIDKGLVYGVVYEPFKKDSHGDHTSPEEIENAAHNFLPSSVMNIDHKDNKPEVKVVESFIAPCDFAYNPNSHGGESMDVERVVKGSWVLVTKIHDNQLLESIRNGERTGYSLEGTAQKL